MAPSWVANTNDFSLAHPNRAKSWCKGLDTQWVSNLFTLVLPGCLLGSWVCNKSITELGTRHRHPSVSSSSYPFLSCIPACSVPAVLCWESPSFLSQVHLACALPWSPSDEVRSEFSLFKNSVRLLDRKIWWAESQSDVGKEGEKASGCCRRCVCRGLGSGFVPHHCKNRWIYSVSGVNTWQRTRVCW